MCFGMVVGWITYYTMRKNTKPRTLADITVIVSALVGPAVMAVFPAPVEGTKQTMFGFYGIGLAIGFFLYYLLFVGLLWKAPERLLMSMGLVRPAAQPPGEEGEGEGDEEPAPEPYDPGIMGARGESPFEEEKE
jgi:hypothetical protein